MYKYLIMLLIIAGCAAPEIIETEVADNPVLPDPVLNHNSIVREVNILSAHGCVWKVYDQLNYGGWGDNESGGFVHRYCDLGGMRHHTYKKGGENGLYILHFATPIPKRLF